MRLTAALRVLRPVNLTFIALTQVLLMYCLFLPVLEFYSELSAINNFQFVALVVSTVLVAGAGYVINDYFDVKSDQVNRPGRVVVGKHLTRRSAMALHTTLSLIGIGLGLYLGIAIGRPWLGGVHLISAIALWYYSTFFKNHLISGNMVISWLTGLVPMIVFLYVMTAADGSSTRMLFFYALIYASFAFLVSMMREIVKDMQDMHGDQADARNTLPIVAGLNTSKIVVDVIGLSVVAAVGVVQAMLLPDRGMLLVIYALVFIQLPIVFVIAKLKSADRATDFRTLSHFIKAIMLAGILTMPLIAYATNPATLL